MADQKNMACAEAGQVPAAQTPPIGSELRRRHLALKHV
jgi:hypothetical protein